MPGVEYKIGLNNSDFMSSVQEASSSVTSFGGGAAMAFAGIGGAVTTATAALGLLRSALAPIANLIKDSIGAAATRESLEASFTPLLKGAENAKAHMAILAKFAETTPFELNNIANASKTLHNLTNGALSAGEGLRLVGDAAASKSTDGNNFEEVAVSVGRLYAALQNGRPMGEPMQRLSELGIITNDTRIKLEELQTEGQKGESVWQVAAKNMERFGGTMEEQSKTMTGKTSNLSDSWTNVLVAFGQPINNALKPFLAEVSASFAEFAPIFSSLGESLGAWISSAAKATKDVLAGVINAVQILMKAYSDGTLGALARQGLEIAFKTAINTLWAGLNGAASAFGQYLVEYGKMFLSLMEMLTKPNFWTGMLKVLTGIAVQVVAYLQEFIGRIIKEIPTLGKTGQGMVDGAKQKKRDATFLMKEGAIDFAPIMDTLAKQAEKSANAIGEAFMDTYNSTVPIMDVKPVIDSFTNSIGELNEKVKTENEEKKKEKEKEQVSETKKVLAPVQEAMEKLKKITFEMAGASSQASVGGGGYGRMVQESKDISKQQLAEAKKSNRLLGKIAQKNQVHAVFA